MSRYIDADKLIDDLEHDIAIDKDHILYVGIDMREKELIQFDKDCKQNCIDMLSKAPAADVRENVRGVLEKAQRQAVAELVSMLKLRCYLRRNAKVLQ